MKAITRNLLAVAVLAAVPFTGAMACTKNAWNGNTGAAAGADAGGPATAGNEFSRYSGECALRSASGEFVTDNTPGGVGVATGESVYRARFYVYTSGNGKVFSATAGDSNAGAEAVGVSFNGSAFTFSGATAGNIAGIVANRWYSVELLHDNDANTFEVDVAGANGFTGSASGTASGTDVGSASLGFIGAGTGEFLVDEFESTRSADTEIGRLCAGDANGDNSRNSGDGLAIRNEFLGGAVATGQPDCNEDGNVNSGDGLCVRALFLGGNGACS